MKSEIFSFQNFKSKVVKNADGDTLGDVYDVLLDYQTGQISCLILTSGGFLGMGEKYIPIPFEALRYNLKTDTYQLDFPKEKFKDAPQFDKEDQSLKPNKKSIQDVYAYYGYKQNS